MLSSLRNINLATKSITKNEWDYEPFLGRQIKSLTIGVIGYGRLGNFFSNYCDNFGAKVIVTMNNGKKIKEELERADAHPYGARPFKRQNYINKFLILTEGIIDKKESDRFLKIVQNLKKLKSGQLGKLNIEVRKNKLKRNLKRGIF